MTKAFYSISDLEAEGFGSRSTIYLRARRGEIQLMRMGGRAGITHAEKERVLASVEPARIRRVA